MIRPIDTQTLYMNTQQVTKTAEFDKIAPILEQTWIAVENVKETKRQSERIIKMEKSSEINKDGNRGEPKNKKEKTTQTKLDLSIW